MATSTGCASRKWLLALDVLAGIREALEMQRGSSSAERATPKAARGRRLARRTAEAARSQELCDGHGDAAGEKRLVERQQTAAGESREAGERKGGRGAASGMQQEMSREVGERLVERPRSGKSVGRGEARREAAERLVAMQQESERMGVARERREAGRRLVKSRWRGNASESKGSRERLVAWPRSGGSEAEDWRFSRRGLCPRARRATEAARSPGGCVMAVEMQHFHERSKIAGMAQARCGRAWSRPQREDEQEGRERGARPRARGARRLRAS
ncbi:hypothetical protein T492DRAFT_837962 [Pavlovales sp. CCMP2436]|nr:hypothetical protein T492DRAFT_837962 [Pavlovales sp. CCMP2436]